MKKVPTIFRRDPENPRLLLQEINPSCDWVSRGEGTPTIKRDGMATLFRGGRWFKRYDCRAGRTPPDGFESTDDPDPVTGHWPGWVPVGDGPDDKHMRDALKSDCSLDGQPFVDGATYELCGPKINKNPERLSGHYLIRHGSEVLPPPIDLSHTGLREYFSGRDIEGIVWHHPDGRMAKIKKRDLGLVRQPGSFQTGL